MSVYLCSATTSADVAKANTGCIRYLSDSPMCKADENAACLKVVNEYGLQSPSKADPAPTSPDEEGEDTDTDDEQGSEGEEDDDFSDDEAPEPTSASSPLVAELPTTVYAPEDSGMTLEKHAWYSCMEALLRGATSKLDVENTKAECVLFEETCMPIKKKDCRKALAELKLIGAVSNEQTKVLIMDTTKQTSKKQRKFHNNPAGCQVVEDKKSKRVMWKVNGATTQTNLCRRSE